MSANSSSGASSGADAAPDSQPANQCPDPCVMAKALNHPFQLASDANRVYWTEYGDALGSANGYVKSCPLSGCGAGPMILAQAQTNPRGIAVDSQNVYWASASYGQVGGAIWSCAVGGCTNPTKLADAAIPYGVAVDSTYVYWVDGDNGSAHRIAKPHAADAVLYDGGDYAGIGGVIGGIVGPVQCAADDAFVYVNDGAGDVYRIPAGGGNPVLMVIPGPRAGSWPLTIDSSNVYYGESGRISRIPKGAIASGLVIVANVPTPDGLALDPDPGAKMIYWSDWGSGNADDGTVGKVYTDGTNPTVLKGSLVTPRAVTVAGSYVFWLSSGTLDTKTNSSLPNTGALMRMAK